MRFDCIYKYTCDFNNYRGLTVFINIPVILMRFDFIYKHICHFNEGLTVFINIPVILMRFDLYL